VQPTNAGDYRVRVFTEWQYLDSKTAVLQINNTGEGSQNAQAFDKFLDLDVFGNPLFIGTFTQNTAPPPPTEQQQLFATAAATTIVRGYTGTQIFNTAGSATAPTEVICGALGGSSEWISLVAEANGTLFLNTDGSTYDTVMAIFVRSPTNSSLLLQLGCDNDGGVDGRTSSITVPVEGGKTNYVLVDGVNGATGILQLNYSLATATILKIIGRTPEGANLVQVNGRAGLRFALQGSPNFGNWVSLVTTNATTDGTFIYTDTGSIGLPNRYYRALILP
jgi:hypothetical protein